MAIIAKNNSDGGGHFEPAPAGVHQAVCVDVVDLGMIETTYQGVSQGLKHKINVVWQIDEAREDGKPFLVFKRYTLSLHEKAALRKDLESWRGRKFTRDEELGFDVETILGANCLLNIAHDTNEHTGRTYANVKSIMPLAKGMQRITGRDYVRKVDRVEDKPETAAPAAPAQWPPADRNTVAPITADEIPF